MLASMVLTFPDFVEIIFDEIDSALAFDPQWSGHFSFKCYTEWAKGLALVHSSWRQRAVQHFSLLNKVTFGKELLRVCNHSGDENWAHFPVGGVELIPVDGMTLAELGNTAQRLLPKIHRLDVVLNGSDILESLAIFKTWFTTITVLNITTDVSAVDPLINLARVIPNLEILSITYDGDYTWREDLEDFRSTTTVAMIDRKAEAKRMTSLSISSFNHWTDLDYLYFSCYIKAQKVFIKLDDDHNLTFSGLAEAIILQSDGLETLVFQSTQPMELEAFPQSLTESICACQNLQTLKFSQPRCQFIDWSRVSVEALPRLKQLEFRGVMKGLDLQSIGQFLFGLETLFVSYEQRCLTEEEWVFREESQWRSMVQMEELEELDVYGIARRPIPLVQTIPEGDWLNQFGLLPE